MIPLLLTGLLLSCSTDVAETTETTETVDTAVAPFTHRFTIAVFADPHVTAQVDRQERLAAAVDWVNTHAADRKIELVVIVGDIGWGGGLPIAKALLDDLTMPYLPVIGDNEVHFGAAQTFDDVFTPQYEQLAATMDDFQRGQVEVHNPLQDETTWLQNSSFEYKDVHIVGLDWCSRDSDAVLSEMAVLHDYDGGTYPFFQDDLQALQTGPDENVLMFSHHPMFLLPGGMNQAQMAQIVSQTAPLEHRVAANFAGHFHVDAEQDLPDAGYSVYITDAIWDDENTVRLVEVHGNDAGFVYEQELVIVP